MDLDVVFLGTSGSAPTAQRATSATLIRRGGERLLVDCGEGTQRQLLRSDVGLVDLEHVFLTHFHADHYLGLPGMLKTFALRGRELPLDRLRPAGLSELYAALRRVFGSLSYPVQTVELAPGDVLDARRLRDPRFRRRPRSPGARLRPLGGRAAGTLRRRRRRCPGRPGRPRTRRSAARRARDAADGRDVHAGAGAGPARPGRTIVLTGDTAPTASVVDAAAGADLLVHEATFCADERERARETQHSTAGRGGARWPARRACGCSR